jgi:peptidoglycan/xylan/chitin deacetylase (PgdA/CDA1 family)
MIHRTPFFMPWLFPRLTWRMPTHEKELYLTFDDGPVPGATEFALHTLARFSAKATFFCIGDNIKKHPDIYKKILADGHTVGNHTFNHLNGWKTNQEQYLANTQLCDREMLYHQMTDNFTMSSDNGKVKLFRPPYGRMTRGQIKTLADYRIIMWDVLSLDYNNGMAPHNCLLHTVKATRPGSIIVFHDSYKAERNMTFTLPRFIEHFSERGFVFKAITG